MKRTWMTLAMAAFLLAPGLAGEEPRAAAAPDVVTQFLGFSDAQRAQFQRLLQSLQAAIGGIEQQLSAKQQGLERLLSAEEADLAAVGRAVLEIRALQRQAGQAFQVYQGSFLAMLGPEQKQKTQVVAQAAQLLPAVAAFAEVRLIEPEYTDAGAGCGSGGFRASLARDSPHGLSGCVLRRRQRR